MPSQVVGQKLARMERDNLEELAQQLFLVLKRSEGKLSVLRQQAAAMAQTQPSPSQGRRSLSQSEKSAVTRVRSHESALHRGTSNAAAAAAGGAAGRGNTARGPRTSRGHPSLGNSGGSATGGGSARNSGASASGGRPPAMPVETEHHNGGSINADAGGVASPRPAPVPRGCTEEQAQKVVDRLYNGAKEARVKRQAQYKLGQMNEDVRINRILAGGRK